MQKTMPSFSIAVFIVCCAGTALSQSSAVNVDVIGNWNASTPIVVRTELDADGTPLTACFRASDGQVIDGNVVVHITYQSDGTDCNVLLPTWKFYLESQNQTIVYDCDGSADATVIDFQTTTSTFPFTSRTSTNGVYELLWTSPWNIGGFSWNEFSGKLLGPYGANPTIGNVQFVSPDINGDGSVNASDVGLFTSILYGSYDVRADFNYDGAVSLPDIGMMTAAVGDACQ